LASDIDVPRPGSFVTEAGIRQAWIFLTLCDNTPETPAETRIYVDTNWNLDLTTFDLDQDELETGLVILCQLINRTLVEATVLSDGGLVLEFDNASRLIIDSAGAAATTHDSWWLGHVGGNS
jgi:hypothetical protein